MHRKTGDQPQKKITYFRKAAYCPDTSRAVVKDSQKRREILQWGREGRYFKGDTLYFIILNC